MPAKTAFKIMRVMKEINKQLEIFENIKHGLLERYGEYDAKGNLKTNEDNTYSINPELKEDFIQELQDVLNESIEMVTNPLEISDLNSFNFSPAELEKIDYLIK